MKPPNPVGSYAFYNFMKKYAKESNKFTIEFIKDFWDVVGNILWNKLVNYNSVSG